MNSFDQHSPHLNSVEDVLHSFDSSIQGLTSEEIETRRARFGLNTLPDQDSVSTLLILLRQFKSALVVILVIAAGISWYVGQSVDAWVIVSAIVVDVIIGFTQEYKAQRAVNSLKKQVVIAAKVLRNEELINVPASELVPGDIIILEEGDSIPADGRVIQSNDLRTIESSLTGESIPVSKHSKQLSGEVVVADRKNMVWRGTLVAGGYARVIVTATGANTQIGDISQSLDEIIEERSTFTRKTNALAGQMAVIAIVSAILIFVTAYFIRGFEFNDVLLTSIAALVAAIPEGLSVIFTIVLAIAASRMAKRNVIIREFAVTETLGTISTILTDKTGTLTQNSLVVEKIMLADEEFSVTGNGWNPEGKIITPAGSEAELTPQLRKLMEIAAVSNNAHIYQKPESSGYELIGDPTEGALLTLARKGGIAEEEYLSIKLDDMPFSSEVKARATLIGAERGNELLVTGAPEKILHRCSAILTQQGEEQLSDSHGRNIQDKIDRLSDKAYRVIALAYKRTSFDQVSKEDMEDLCFVGLVGMIDPPRVDVKEAIEKCKSAGIRVVMLTGDHINTAVAVARDTGILKLNESADRSALTETDLLNLNEEEFDRIIQEVNVFARLTPRMKLRIAGRLQAAGELIAMTGDGVNDAPALKKADAGIAMGIGGTDTAREASDVILTDNNFTSIVNAIEEGRIAFNNARQTSFFLITTNLAESATIMLAILVGLPLPLTVTQLLWLNLVTDGITDVALATEAGHGDVMERKPMDRNERILNCEIIPFLLINLVLMTGLSLGTFYFYLEEGVRMAQTCAFIVLSFTQLFNVYNMRSLRLPILKIGFLSNRLVNYAVLLSLIMMYVIIEIPAVAEIFNFERVSIWDATILLVLSSSVFWVTELYKSVRKK